MSSGELSQDGYQKWANNLVDKDWEIYWQTDDGDDNNDGDNADDGDDGMGDDVVEKLECQQGSAAISTALLCVTSPGQETADERTIEKRSTEDSTVKTDGIKVSSDAKICTEVEDKMPIDRKSRMIDNADENNNDDQSEDSKGSIIDDWYEAHVLGIIDESKPQPWIFRVHFAGDEEIYKLCLLPGKIRPSSRGWVQRTVAILKPLSPAGELPPDTSTIEDKEKLQNLKLSIITSDPLATEKYAVDTMTKYGQCDENDNNDIKKNELLVALPTHNDLRRIQHLRYLLESQILLRERLSKIENHDDLFTDGVRNPTEKYVNHLCVCCKDLSQACAWYCKSWKLLSRYFYTDNQSPSNGVEFDQLTIKALIREYLELGKNTILNTAMIDTNASGPSTKRRQMTPDSGGSTRRTKRRRKNLSPEEEGEGKEEEENASDGFTYIFSAVSKLDSNIQSTAFVNDFVQAVTSNTGNHHVCTMGEMLRSISHLIVHPILTWKVQADRILGRDKENKKMLHDNIASKNMKKSKEEIENDPRRHDEDELSEEEIDETKEKFTYEEIQNCVSAKRSNRVLSRFNLFDEIHNLRVKLRNIETSHTNALELLNLLCVEMPQARKRQEDEVLSGLSAILNEMNDPRSTLFNIDKLGKLSHKEMDSMITRNSLSKAIELRSWFVDVRHAVSVRERQIFVNRLISKIESNSIPDPKDVTELAAIPQISQKRSSSIQNIIDLQTSMNNYNELIKNRGDDFLVFSTDVTSLRSILSELKVCPVILPLEEKVATRIDVIEWYEEASDVLRRIQFGVENNVSFVDLESIFRKLERILSGLSDTRSKLIEAIDFNIVLDEEIRGFVLNDITILCEKAENEVRRIYFQASAWKERADSIITWLRMHGNMNAGQPINTPKPPAMVDIKRITDLIEEYPAIKIQINGYIERLYNIRAESFEWSQKIHDTLLEYDHVLFTGALSFMERERDHRPRGIIVDPNRSVVDSIVDILSWYEKSKSSIAFVVEKLRQISTQNDPTTIAAAYSSLISGQIYNVLVDGLDVLKIYSDAEKVSDEVTIQYKAKSDQSLIILDKYFHLRKTSRAPSGEKLKSVEPLQSLLSLMCAKDKREGFPLHVMLWFDWHLIVSDLVYEHENKENHKLSHGEVSSLLSAKQLKTKEPSFLDDIVVPGIWNLIQTKSSELLDFELIIEKAENEEKSIKVTLSKAKDLLREPLKKSENIRQHLGQLKELFTMTKDRSLGKGGLALNVNFENQLDQHVKYFSWLIRTLQYKVLHESEASFSCTSNEEKTGSNRIPWNVLVYIHERIPIDLSGCRESTLSILRVQELYIAAKRWQDEISRTTLISNRGNKRRGARTFHQENATQFDNQDEEKNEKIQIEKMELLAKDRILSKVNLPREKAVNLMMNSTKKFNIQLQNVLAQDFVGNQDNAPLPNGKSLVSPHGQFILYRLTGSSLFSMMQKSMQALSEVGDKVFAQTPGKKTFDWMRSSVSWIENLLSAVVTHEHLLVIPLIDAMKLIESGEQIFLQTYDDMRQTLSEHGIYVSTSSVKKKLTVVLKKDGAHHSVGGIIIRWCPILFDALRADVSKLKSWENELWKIIDDFNSFVASIRNHLKNDEADLFQWYCFRVKVQSALEEGQHSLVVSPKKNVIDSFTSLLSVISNYLENNCPRELDAQFSKRLYSHSANLCDDRFRLLDALLHRREGADNIMPLHDNTASFAAHQPERSYRDECRSNLESAFVNAAAVLNLDSENDSSVKDLAALKAWEIEKEMFNKFQEQAGMNYVTELYEEKAQSLKIWLDDVNNLSLCLNVLSSDMKTNVLIKMTPDQLARHKVQAEQDKEKMRLLEDTTVLPPVTDNSAVSSRSCNNPKPLNNKATTPKTENLVGILKPSKTHLAWKHVENSESRIDEEPSDRIKGELRIDIDADGAPTLDSDDEDESNPNFSSVSSPEKISTTMITSSVASRLSPRSSSKSSLSKYCYQTARSPPPPPPSLANSFETSTEDEYDPSSIDSSSSSFEKNGTRITDAFGGNIFRLEIHGRVKYTFSAAFYQGMHRVYFS